MPDDTHNSTDGHAGADNNQQHQEPPKTFTQEDVNRLLAEEKRKSKKEIAELKSKADQWDNQQEDTKSEIQREREARAKAEADLAALRLTKDLEKWQAKHGRKNNIPESDWDRLRGSTESEIEEDAKLWAKSRGLDRAGGPTPKGSGKGGELTENDVMNAAFRSMARGGSIGR